MRKAWFLFILGIILVTANLPLLAADPYNQYMSVADVEKVTGIHGLQLVSRNSVTGAYGQLNIANGSKQMVLMVNFFTASYFKKSFDQIKPYIKEPIRGIADQAYVGPKENPQYLIYFCKKNQSASLSTFMNPNGKATMLSMDQLVKLAKLLASRMS